jgi:hypothetical protein
VNKGVLMHDMKLFKSKAAGRGICNECCAPELPFFKGTLKEGAWMSLGNNTQIVQIPGNCGLIC